MPIIYSFSFTTKISLHADEETSPNMARHTEFRSSLGTLLWRGVVRESYKRTQTNIHRN